MDRDWENPPWYSSYEKNRYGDLFYALVRVYQPEKVVELGTKAGYSAYHIARGLKDNGKGSLDCYDLWENYEFNSAKKSAVEENLKEFKGIASFNQRNVIGVEGLYEAIDILHVDVSNEGGILEKIIPKWIDRVRHLVIIEGGSSERDKIEWMAKYNKTSIKEWLKKFSKSRKDVEYLTLKPFPSVTIIQKT